MKLRENIFIDHEADKIIVQRTFANDPYIEDVKRLKDAGVGQTGESRMVGRIPMHVLSQWLKEAGVDWSDRGACQEVVKRKMLSGEFDKLRVWEGTY